MRRRNEVPKLKNIAARKVSWPDGIDRKEAEGYYPSTEQYCRDTIYHKFYQKKYNKLGRQRYQEIEKWKETASFILDNWIHLASYYGTTFADLDDLKFLIKSYPIENLDFLRQGFVLTDQRNKTYMIPRIGRIPHSVLPRTVYPKMWKDIVGCLIRLKMCESVKELQIKFGKESETKGRGSLRKSRAPFFTKSSHTAFLDSSFEFESTIWRFKGLTKLVIKGLDDDSVLSLIGKYCECLKHLDITENTFSADGIRSLFFTSRENEMLHRTIYDKISRKKKPNDILRPLTKTLEYFEMGDIPWSESSFDFKTGICIACPQLVKTIHNLFFAPRGDIKMMCRGFLKDHPLYTVLRQDLMLYVRGLFAHEIMCFVRQFLQFMPSKDPAVQVRVDEDGREVTILFFSEDYVVAQFDLENLYVISFTSYWLRSIDFIDIDILSQFSQGLLHIKAPLTGCVSKKSPLSHLRFVTCPMIRTMDTLKSIIKKCPCLKYLEIREILYNDTHINDEVIEDLFLHENEHLEVLRFLFQNKISMTRGVTWIITKCKGLRILGDLKLWGVTEKTFLSFTLQLRYHNFRVSVEYDGVIHYTDGYGGELLR